MSHDNLYRATRPRVSDTVFLRLLSIRPERVRVQRQCWDICIQGVGEEHCSVAAVTMSDLCTRDRMLTLLS